MSNQPDNSEIFSELDVDYEKDIIRSKEFEEGEEYQYRRDECEEDDYEEYQYQRDEHEEENRDLLKNSRILFKTLCESLFYMGTFEDLISSFPNTKFDLKYVQNINHKWIEIHQNLNFLVENIPSNFDWELEEISNILESIKGLIEAKSQLNDHSAFSVIIGISDLFYNTKALKSKNTCMIFSIILIFLDNLQNLIDKYEEEMPFIYIENQKLDVNRKLDDYLNRAVSFNILHYEGSIASKIDDLIKTLNGCAQTHELDEDGDKCEMSFVALVAPSLVGKTQLSFILRHRSLYFALSQSDSIQEIYLNFESLNEMIFKCSIKDIEKIKKYLKKNQIMESFKVDAKFFEYLSANYMTRNMGDEKFMVLGLLLALVEDAENTFDKIDDSLRPAWMYHHAKRHNMIVKGASIREIRSVLPRFEKYFVFWTNLQKMSIMYLSGIL